MDPSGSYHTNKNGWGDLISWRAWAQKFVEHKKKMGRAKYLLYVDGASHHSDPVVLELFIKEGITVIVLAPGTTHKTQPLDVGVFGPMKQVAFTRAQRDNITISAKNVAAYFNAALRRTSNTSGHGSAAWAIEAFRKAGLFPFNPSIFTDVDFAPSDAHLGISVDHPAILARPLLSAKKRHELTTLCMAPPTPEASAALHKRALRALEREPMVQVLTGTQYLEALAKKEAVAAEQKTIVAESKARRVAAAAEKQAEIARKKEARAAKIEEREAKKKPVVSAPALPTTSKRGRPLFASAAVAADVNDGAPSKRRRNE